jgi:predicted alpha/beta-fold hydrolase
MTATGGHVGFVAPTCAPGRFWAAERVMAFASEAIALTDVDRTRAATA